jgi:predicted NBD/HSP70 family sugar kinase
VICALGALHIHVGLSDLDGAIIDQTHRDWEIARGPAETLETTLAMVDELRQRNDTAPIWGVAVGLPGPVDFATGRPVAPPIMPGWNGFDVRRRFEQHFDAPVWVDNDVNLLAYGERARRRDDDLDLIYCKIGSGIGAGLLSRGHVHRGANGAAGDIGHVRVADSDVQCRCGKIGCLEAVAGGWALTRDAEAAIAAGATGQLARQSQEAIRPTPENISRAAENGDALAITLVQASARVVGEAIAALVNMFNPSVIVIGGAVASAGEVFLAEVRQRVYELSLPLATRDLSIVQSVDDVSEPLRGGVEMLKEQLFDVTFPRWFAERQPPVSLTAAAAELRR